MSISKLTVSSFDANSIPLTAISSSPQFNGMKNLLINGDFRIWQKGTDLNPLVSGNGITGVDRWTNQYVDFTARVRKVEDSINGETVDTVEMTKTGGTYSSCELTQKVEATTAKYLRGQTVTFSFWVKKVGTTFGSHACQFWLGDSETVDDTGWTNSRTYDRGRSSGVTGTNTTVTFSNNSWTKYSVTRTLSSDTNTIYCTMYTVNTPVSEGIRIAKCQLEIGSVATDFERRPIALETQMAQRYYEPFGNGWPVRGESTNSSCVLFGHFKSDKRASPTISVLTTNMRMYEWGVADRDASTVTINSSSMMLGGGHIKLSGWGTIGTGTLYGMGYNTSGPTGGQPFAANSEF